MQLRSLKIGTRLAIGFAVVLAMLAVIVVAGNLVTQSNGRRMAEELAAAGKKTALANEMKSELLQAAISTRNIGLESDVGAMQKHEDQVRMFNKSYATAAAALANQGTSQKEKDILASLDALNKKMEEPLTQVLGMATSFNTEQAAKILAETIDPITQETTKLLDALIAEQHAATQSVMDSIEQNNKRLGYFQYAVGVGAFLVGALCAVLISRSILRPLSEAVVVTAKVAAGDLTSSIDIGGKDEIGDLMRSLSSMNDSLAHIVTQVREGTDSIRSGADEIAAGNVDLSSRTDEQAAALEETASSMEEMTATVRQNAENARQGNSLAVAATEVAERGGKVVGDVVSTMDDISASSKKIVEIIGVIDSIAFQTNILALNAAVEAARAGEQGRGFAVVASEVRSLAQRSAAAAKEIKDLIGASVARIDAGSALVSKAGSTMSEIVSSIGRVNTIMGDIMAASQEQSSGIDQVGETINQMDRATQQNAALVEEAAAAATALTEQAGALYRLVDTFKVA